MCCARRRRRAAPDGLAPHDGFRGVPRPRRDCIARACGRSDMGGADMRGARGLTLALSGRWHGGYGAAPCPACQPRGPQGAERPDAARWRRQAVGALQARGLPLSRHSRGGWHRPRTLHAPGPRSHCRTQTRAAARGGAQGRTRQVALAGRPAHRRHARGHLPSRARHHLRLAPGAALSPPSMVRANRAAASRAGGAGGGRRRLRGASHLPARGWRREGQHMRPPRITMRRAPRHPRRERRLARRTRWCARLGRS
jgi:hypothetical protein